MNNRTLKPYSALLLLTLRRIRHLFRVRLFALATLTAAAVRALVGAMTARRVPRWMTLSNAGPLSREDKKLRSLLATGRHHRKAVA